MSSGTERANITGNPNVNAGGQASVAFPRQSGYSSAGTVTAVGTDVERVKIGDRVVVYWGKHAAYNTVPESHVVKIESDAISLQEAALSFIAAFSLAAVRKTAWRSENPLW